MKAIIPEGTKVIGPYSPAIETGELVYFSGQIPVLEGKIVEGDIKMQAQQCLENLTNVLNAANLNFENIVKTTIFLTDINDFAAVNEVYGNYFGTPYPARTTVAVSALPLGARIEIEAIAKKTP